MSFSNELLFLDRLYYEAEGLIRRQVANLIFLNDERGGTMLEHRPNSSRGRES